MNRTTCPQFRNGVDPPPSGARLHKIRPVYRLPLAESEICRPETVGCDSITMRFCLFSYRVRLCCGVPRKRVGLVRRAAVPVAKLAKSFGALA